MFKESSFWFKQQSVKGFPTRLVTSNTDIRCASLVGENSQAAIKQYLEGDKSAVTVLHTDRRREAVMIAGESKYVLKRCLLNGFNKRFRNTFAIARVYGYPGLYNELINTQQANQILPNTPKVVGYGVSKQNGLVIEEFLLFEFIEDCVPMEKLFASGQYPTEQLLDVVVDEYLKALSKQVIHLDLNLTNIMVSEDLTERWLIDFEYCSFADLNASSSLGFLLGYFHHYWAHQYIDETSYDDYITKKVEDIEWVDQGVFWPVYNMFKNTSVPKKLRYIGFANRKSHTDIIEAAKEYVLGKC